MEARKIFLVLVGLPALLASSHETPRDEVPGSRLRARVEAHLEQRRARLQQSPSHYGLVFETDQGEFLDFMQQIRVHRDGSAFVLGTPYVAEAHGGGVLALLLDNWRPGGRAARLRDRFVFGASGSFELGTIYRGHKQQIFLPIAGRDTNRIDGQLPDAPRLPKMRFRFWTQQQPIETDSYKFLGLLISQEADPYATWTNQLDQELSVDLLMRAARQHYMAKLNAREELEDHTNLHLVDLLLAYSRRLGGKLDANAIKRRFLEVELTRRDFGSEWSEILGHYVESLGWLAADPHVTWEPKERLEVRSWLEALERDRFHDLASVKVQHLSHLLKGLRMIDEHRFKLIGQDSERLGLDPSSRRCCQGPDARA